MRRVVHYALKDWIQLGRVHLDACTAVLSTRTCASMIIATLFTRTPNNTPQLKNGAT